MKTIRVHIDDLHVGSVVRHDLAEDELAKWILETGFVFHPIDVTLSKAGLEVEHGIRRLAALKMIQDGDFPKKTKRKFRMVPVNIRHINGLFTL
jgi:hypothetical protein